VFALDLHTHTRFFHGFQSRPTPFDPVGAALLGRIANQQGLDGVAVTNHDYYTSFDCDGVVEIPGIEVSTTRGHVLVVGPDPPVATNPGTLEPESVIELAHDRGCAAIIAHPYRNSTLRDTNAPFDAIEINGKHPRSREWPEHLAMTLDLPTVGGSDAHYPVEVGRAYTVVDADELTPEAVVAAIREGRVEARVSDARLHRLIHRVYRRVHRGKGHLDRPAWADSSRDTASGPEHR